MRKALLILFLFFSTQLSYAQNWGGGIDQQTFNWGFSFNYVASEFKVFKKANWRNRFKDPEQNFTEITDSLASISSPLSAGFAVGFVLNYNLSPNLDLRSTPNLVFNDRLMNYHYSEQTINSSFIDKKQKVQATVLDIPLGIKLKSDRLLNFRSYLLAGMKYSIDLSAGKKPKDAAYAAIDKQLKNVSKFASYEVGLGFDFYFEYFKMSPEIKISQSVKDVLLHENHPYATPIDRALLRNFTFSLYFE
jgi:hypothetical protein